MKVKLSLLALTLISACSSLDMDKRRFLDSTTHEESSPRWVSNLKTTWEDKGKILLKSSHTVRGDERVNACFDLARLDAKETLLTEIAEDVRGTMDNAQQEISENAEAVLGKVRSAEFNGRITGLRFSEQYFERYLIGGVERVDCHVLGEIKESDYNRVKSLVVNKLTAIDPRIKEAISQKHIDFFKREPVATQIENMPEAQAD